MNARHVEPASRSECRLMFSTARRIFGWNHPQRNIVRSASTARSMEIACGLLSSMPIEFRVAAEYAQECEYPLRPERAILHQTVIGGNVRLALSRVIINVSILSPPPCNLTPVGNPHRPARQHQTDVCARLTLRDSSAIIGPAVARDPAVFTIGIIITLNSAKAEG